jgi:hypothetical protein
LIGLQGDEVRRSFSSFYLHLLLYFRPLFLSFDSFFPFFFLYSFLISFASLVFSLSLQQIWGFGESTGLRFGVPSRQDSSFAAMNSELVRFFAGLGGGG